MVGIFLAAENVWSLVLPGSYSEKITHLGQSMLEFTKLKHLDLSRNAVESLQVRMHDCTCTCMCGAHIHKYRYMYMFM